MAFYSLDVYIVMIVLSVFLLIGAWFHYVKKDSRLALGILLLAGFALRLFMASVDPFLQSWDERFHALVAKNMIDNPFQPMLRVFPIMPYIVEDWCCNHIWVHKQPLFLWQMALSMKIFGINEIAMRLPSVIMGTISIYFIYDIGRKWIKDKDVAFLAALLFTVSYYQLELSSGKFSLDHNDVAFGFYVTAGIWSFLRYLHSERPLKWAIITGVFVGCSILVKWLTGLLIFGGWGLYLLLSCFSKFEIKKWIYLTISLLTSILVFVPWQIYIIKRFPLESAIMYDHNRRHIFEVLEEHSGTIWYHFEQMGLLYGYLVLVFILLGTYFIFRDKKIDKKLSVSFVVMVVVIYSFFSFIVKTKMPAFVFPVHSLIWITVASGIIYGFKKWNKKIPNYILLFFIVLLVADTLKPWEISGSRSITKEVRNAKIENTQIYKSLDLTGELKERVILNCNSFEDTELMFYQDVNAYHWYPQENVLDSLIQKGYKFAAFKNHGDYLLPEYIAKNPEIVIIDEELR